MPGVDKVSHSLGHTDARLTQALRNADDVAGTLRDPTYSSAAGDIAAVWHCA